MLLVDVLFVFASLTTSAVASTQCYCRDSNQLFYGCGGAVPCGAPNANGFVQCCAQGDICGADGFCHFTHGQVGTSGYYLGSCTDPSFKDESCPQPCTDNPTQDVVFSSSSGLWSCCYGSSGKLDCSAPGQETFEAPDPQALFAIPFASLTAVKTTSSTSNTPSSTPSNAPPAAIPNTSSSSIATRSAGTTLTTSSSSSSSSSSSAAAPQSQNAIASPNPSPTDSPSQTPGTTPAQAASSSSSSQTIPAANSLQTSSSAPSSSSSDLSTGAKAGIGIGVAAVAVAAIAAVAFFLLKRSRQNNQNAAWHVASQNSSIYPPDLKHGPPVEMSSSRYTSYAEMAAPAPPAKDWKAPLRSELPAN